MEESDNVYGPGGICETCGHFAGRHDEAGCHTEDLVKAGIRTEPCKCEGFKWDGKIWYRPWLSAPEGLEKE